MTSAIDATKPITGAPTTQSVRDNFATAAAEITALQAGTTITLSGDVTGSGTAAIPTTLATVNGNVGTFQGLTVNAKGQVTAAANQNYVTGGPYVAIAGGTMTGLLTAPNYGGTATNNNAAAGSIGEYLSGSAAGVALSSGSPTTITSLTLTAGDWDAWGRVSFSPSGGATPTALEVGLNTTTNAFSGSPDGGGAVLLQAGFGANGVQSIVTAPVRMSLAVSTVVYVVGQMNFAAGVVSASAFIAARRVR